MTGKSSPATMAFLRAVVVSPRFLLLRKYRSISASSVLDDGVDVAAAAAARRRSWMSTGFDSRSPFGSRYVHVMDRSTMPSRLVLVADRDLHRDAPAGELA